jgi:DNA invertase Pin-like site-specific DNA recombinase
VTIYLVLPLERSLNPERTRAGATAARGRGVKFRRKPKLTTRHVRHARKLIDGGEPVQDVAALMRVSRVTLYRAMRDHSLKG